MTGDLARDAPLVPSEEPLVVRSWRACQMLSCKRDKLYGLYNAGEIEGYLDGGRRLWVVGSIKAYTKRKADADRAARKLPALPQ
jgi:hypothetical protein